MGVDTVSKQNKPETSFILIEEWFKKCEFSARMIGKEDSAKLWEDGLQHLKHFQALAQDNNNQNLKERIFVLERQLEAANNLIANLKKNQVPTNNKVC